MPNRTIRSLIAAATLIGTAVLIASTGAAPLSRPDDSQSPPLRNTELACCVDGNNDEMDEADMSEAAPAVAASVAAIDEAFEETSLFPENTDDPPEEPMGGGVDG